jgi:predicted RNA-binding Zn-ribbon protein involved in translation (DUF1610 family)
MENEVVTEAQQAARDRMAAERYKAAQNANEAAASSYAYRIKVEKEEEAEKEKRSWQYAGENQTHLIHEATVMLEKLGDPLAPWKKQLAEAKTTLAKCVAHGFVDKVQAYRDNEALIDAEVVRQRTENADRVKKDYEDAQRELKEHLARGQAPLNPSKSDNYPCPNCGQDILRGIAFHTKGEPGSYDYCIVNPQKALQSGRFTREQLRDLGFAV